MIEFVKAYANEDNVTVLRDLLTNLVHLSSLLLSTDFHDKFSVYIRQLIKPISLTLGWDPKEGETSLQSMCRALVLRVLAVYGDQDVINEAKIRFEKNQSGEKLIPADLRTAV